MARIYWVALERWHVLRKTELQQLLAHARQRVYDRLPGRTKDVLDLPKSARQKLIVGRRKLLAARKYRG